MCGPGAGLLQSRQRNENFQLRSGLVLVVSMNYRLQHYSYIANRFIYFIAVVLGPPRYTGFYILLSSNLRFYQIREHFYIIKRFCWS